MRSPGWPAVLADGDVTVRPLRLRDGAAWSELRRRNETWLRPWEATPPGPDWAAAQLVPAYAPMVRALRRKVRAGSVLPFAIMLDGDLVGQVTVGNIVRGSLNSAYVGYWVDERVAGRGVMPTALALVVDHALGPVRLHRVEANIRPENHASRRVVEKLGFREEGLHRRYLHINGAYRDHLTYALTSEDAPLGVLARWHAVRARHTGAGA